MRKLRRLPQNNILMVTAVSIDLIEPRTVFEGRSSDAHYLQEKNKKMYFTMSYKLRNRVFALFSFQLGTPGFSPHH